MALVAYRNLMRAARIAFQGDAPVLAAAQGQIRDGFRQKASLDPADKEVSGSIQHAEDVARVLRENVVQGQKLPKGTDTYKLRIHEFTERGDNESIKMAGTGTNLGGCCGGSRKT